MTTISEPVKTSLKTMETLLTEALERTREGNKCMDENNQNGAIGNLIEVEGLLTSAKALYDAALIMHRKAI